MRNDNDKKTLDWVAMNSAPYSSNAFTTRTSLPQWQRQLRAAVTDADTLFELLALPQTYLPAARRAAKLFPLRVPRAFVARMQPGDINDPLLRQVLPLDAEHAQTPGFTLDAVGDNASTTGDGLLHKYYGRALVITTGACAVNCRYCFRRHFDYGANNGARQRWQGVISHSAGDPSISEVILSGGDPLSLADDKLAALTDALDDIAHVRRLRWHTRLPIVLPDRIDDAFMRYFAAIRQRCILVIHANHANELNADVEHAMMRLRSAGALLLNQSVLLRGVNDEATTLADLSERLFEIGVMPYYLHLLDRVTGTAHFEVGQQRAEQLMQTLAGRLPGYLVPKLARETAGARAKSVIGHGA